MAWRFFIALTLAGLLAGCGYKPAAGRISPTSDAKARFLPFLVRNDTPELSLANVVATAARGELGRRNLLASSSDRAEGPHYRVDMRIRRVVEVPASYSPEGDIIEYFGQLYFNYHVFPVAETRPVAAVNNARLTYRYDFRSNPQNIRIARHAAIADTIREWIPLFLWQTSTAPRHKATVRPMPEPVTATVMPGTMDTPIPGALTDDELSEDLEAVE